MTQPAPRSPRPHTPTSNRRVRPHAPTRNAISAPAEAAAPTPVPPLVRIVQNSHPGLRLLPQGHREVVMAHTLAAFYTAGTRTGKVAAKDTAVALLGTLIMFKVAATLLEPMPAFAWAIYTLVNFGVILHYRRHEKSSLFDEYDAQFIRVRHLLFQPKETDT